MASDNLSYVGISLDSGLCGPHNANKRKKQQGTSAMCQSSSSNMLETFCINKLLTELKIISHFVSTAFIGGMKNNSNQQLGEHCTNYLITAYVYVKMFITFT